MIRNIHGKRADYNKEQQFNKLSIFDGEDETWLEWSFVARNFFARHDPRMRTLLEAASGAPDELDNSDFTEDVMNLSQKLMTDLSLHCKGKALRWLMALPDPTNGFEGWRRLCKRFDEKGAASLKGHVHSILNFKFGRQDQSLGEFLDKLQIRQNLVSDYEKRLDEGKSLDDDIKVSTVIEGAPKEIRKGLLENLDRYNTFDQLYKYLEERHTFSRPFMYHDKRTGGNDNSMDVDALGKKGGKKGDKGKG